MRALPLGLAAIAAISFSSPALAKEDIPFTGVPNAKGVVGTLGGPGFTGGIGHPGFGGGFGHGDFDRRRGHGQGDSGLGIWVNGGQWAQYNNQSFQSDSYNDWWHDRPDRAYPAWMRNNQNCERLWYSGGTLRC